MFESRCFGKKAEGRRQNPDASGGRRKADVRCQMSDVRFGIGIHCEGLKEKRRNAKNPALSLFYVLCWSVTLDDAATNDIVAFVENGALARGDAFCFFEEAYPDTISLSLELG
jgi:hypothetical protein